MKNQFEKIKSMSLIEFKDFLLGMKVDGTGCGNCVLRDKYCNSIVVETCEANILNWLNSKIDMTADEMFEDLGYKKTHSDRNGCNYYHKEIDRSGIKSEYIIHVLANISSVLFTKYESIDGRQFCANIDESEDEAIHKKIKELKKWEEDN